MQLLLTIALLMGMWCLLSGMFDPLHLGSGLVLSVLIGLAAQRWRTSEPLPALRMIAYVPWLAAKVIASNLHVARLVMSPRARFAPRFVELPPGVTGDRALTMMGCSITLTPGTVTVDIDAERMLVHTLDDPSLELIESGALARRIERVFGPDAGVGS